MSHQALAQSPSCVSAPAAIPGWGDDLRRSVAVSDPAVFAGAAAQDFSLGRTLGAIIASREISNTPAERVALLQGMVRSFQRTGFVNPDGNLTVSTPARPGEGALDPVAMLDPADPNGFRPVAVFNRLDLAPADWRTCGEHRIVYAKNSASALDRMTLIFEATVPNPGGDPQGCRPIAQFWNGLSSPGLAPAEIARRLAAFFYAGDTDGNGTSDLPAGGAVIQAANLGLEFGQVRGNLFVTNGDFQANPWQLREWRIVAGLDGAPVFAATTVKENPLPALYAAPVPGDSPDLASRRDDFTGRLLGRVAATLLALEATAGGGGVSQDELLARLSAGFPGEFDTFVSISQGDGDDPLARSAGHAALLDALTARLAGMPAAARCGVTPQHLLNRAGALSCGGCHQFSVGQAVAPGVAWPATVQGGFVHVDERGTLSPALLQHFLPERRRGLEAFLASTQPMVATTSPAASASPVAAALGRLAATASPLQRLEVLRDAEAIATRERRELAVQPGAFTPARRTH